MANTLKTFKKVVVREVSINFYRNFLHIFIKYFSGILGLTEATKIISLTHNISVSQAYKEIEELQKSKLIRKIDYGNHKLIIARNSLFEAITGEVKSVKNKNHKYNISKLKYKYLQNSGFLNLKNSFEYLDQIIENKNLFPGNKTLRKKLKDNAIYMEDFKIKNDDPKSVSKLYFICFLSENISKRGITNKIKLLESISKSFKVLIKDYPEAILKYQITFYSTTDFSILKKSLEDKKARHGKINFKKI